MVYVIFSTLFDRSGLGYTSLAVFRGFFVIKHTLSQGLRDSGGSEGGGMCAARSGGVTGVYAGSVTFGVIKENIG